MTCRHRLTSAIAVAVAVAPAALAASPALARIDPPPTPAYNSGSESAEQPVVVRTVNDDFDWGAAAIGAGGAGALVAIVAVGFACTTRDRTRITS